MKKKCLALGAALALCVAIYSFVAPNNNTKDEEGQKYIEDVLAQELDDDYNDVEGIGADSERNSYTDEKAEYDKYANFDKKLKQKIKKDAERESWTEAYKQYDALSEEQKQNYSGAIPGKYKVSMEVLDSIEADQEKYDLTENIKKNEQAASNNQGKTKSVVVGSNRISNELVGASGDGGGIGGNYQDPSQPINTTVEYDDEGLPKSYDLRNLMEMGVDDQMSVGLCWDFASTNSLESFMYLHGLGNHNYSEIHANVLTSQYFYGMHALDTSGDFGTYAKYLSLSGVTEERESEYYGLYSEESQDRTDEGLSSNPGFPDYGKYSLESYYDRETTDVHITKYVSFPTISGDMKQNLSDEYMERYRSALKRHIIENGSVYFSISSGCMNNASGYIYCSVQAPHNHAMSIIGWIDDIDTSWMIDEGGNAPAHRGAYIVKNSWGDDSEYGHYQYLYMPYDCYDAESDLYGIASNSKEDAILLSDFEGAFIPDYIRKHYGQFVSRIDGEEYIPSGMFSIYVMPSVFETFTSEDYADYAKLGTADRAITIVNYDGVNVEYLANFPNMDDLTLDNVNELSDETLEYIIGKVKYLTIKNTEISSFDFLENAGNLTHLEFVGINNLDLTKIPQGNSILSIAIEACTNVLGLERLGDSENLGHLELKSLGLSSVADLGLADNERLYYLSLEGNRMTDFSGMPEKAAYIDLADNSLEAYPAGINSTAVRLDSNKLSSLSGISPKTTLINLSDNQAVISSVDIDNPNLGLIIMNSEISSFDVFDNNRISSLNLNNNNLSEITEIDASIEYLYFSNNDIFGSISNVKNIENLIYLSVLNIDEADITIFNSMDNIDNLILGGNKVSGKYSGKARNLTLDFADNSDLKLSSECSIIRLSLGKVSRKTLQRIKSSNAMDKDGYEFGSSISYYLENDALSPEELESLEMNPEYDFYNTNSVISQNQRVSNIMRNIVVEVPVSANQKEYYVDGMSRVRQVVLKGVGNGGFFGDYDMTFGKKSIKANDASLVGKEYSAIVYDNDGEGSATVTLRFVEAR